MLSNRCRNLTQLCLQGEAQVFLAQPTLIRPMRKIPRSNNPHARSLEAGDTYNIPFAFTIPAQILPQACLHSSDAELHNAHLLLPPSLDISDTGSSREARSDETASDAIKIQYYIKVRVSQAQGAHATGSVCEEQSLKVRISPTIEQEPHPWVEALNRDCPMRLERPMKNTLRNTLGTLFCECTGLTTLVIPHYTTTFQEPSTTTIALFFRFDTAGDYGSAVQLRKVTTNIRASTFFSLSPHGNFPTMPISRTDRTRVVIQETVYNASFNTAPLLWERHSMPPDFEVSEGTRRSSCPSTRTVGLRGLALKGRRMSDQSSHYRTFYTSSIQIPVTLPQGLDLIPTFHSCFVSRVYHLIIRLSFCAAIVGQSALCIEKPISIFVQAPVNEGVRVTGEQQEFDDQAGIPFGVSRSLPIPLPPPPYEYT